MSISPDRKMQELIDLFRDSRSHVELIDYSELFILADFLCHGPVQRADGQIVMVDRHRVRLVGAPGIHGLLSLFDPVGDERPYHPNIMSKPPYIICSNLENQVQRGPSVPYLSVVSLVWDLLCGAQWDASLGIYNAEAARYYAAASARGELPFDDRTVI